VKQFVQPIDERKVPLDAVLVWLSNALRSKLHRQRRNICFVLFQLLKSPVTGIVSLRRLRTRLGVCQHAREGASIDPHFITAHHSFIKCADNTELTQIHSDEKVLQSLASPSDYQMTRAHAR
jgi:hypothetical protein